jgi:hypothetical protein
MTMVSIGEYIYIITASIVTEGGSNESKSGARFHFVQHLLVMLAPAQDRPVTVALIGAGQRGGVSRIPFEDFVSHVKNTNEEFIALP